MLKIDAAVFSELTGIKYESVYALLRYYKVKLKQEDLEKVIDLIIHLRLKEFYGKVEHSTYFFENRSCAYYPCHKELKRINCLFCYCPLYHQCDTKECKTCTFIHKPLAYRTVLKLLKKSGKLSSFIKGKDENKKTKGS